MQKILVRWLRNNPGVADGIALSMNLLLTSNDHKIIILEFSIRRFYRYLIYYFGAIGGDSDRIQSSLCILDQETYEFTQESVVIQILIKNHLT